MAINRFTQSAKANIVNTQVLPRTELLLGALQQRQAKYDQQVDKLSSTIGTVTGYQVVGDAARQYLKNTEDTLTEASSTLLSKDLADPSVQGEVNGLINSIASDETLKMHLNAAEQYKKFTESYEDLSKRGKFTDANAYRQQQAWKRYKLTGGLTGDEFIPIEEAVDVEAETKKYFDMLKASGGDAIKFLKDGTAYKNSSKGIDGKDIQRAAELSFNNYVNSQVGRQLSREYDMLVDQGVLDSKVSKTQYLKNALLGTGLKYTYNESSSNADVALRASKLAADRKAEKEVENNAGDGYLPAMGRGNKVEVDSDGRYNVPAWKDLWGAITGNEVRTPEELAVEKAWKEGAKAAGMDVKSYVEELNKDPNIRMSYYNTKQSEEMSKRFFNAKTGGGQFFTRTIKTPEFPDGISAQEYLSEKGLTEQEAEHGFTIVGEVYPDNPYTPKGMVALIGGEQVIIDDSVNLSVNDEKGADAIMTHKAMQAKYSKTGETKFVEGGYEFHFRYNPSTGTVQQVSKPKKQ